MNLDAFDDFYAADEDPDSWGLILAILIVFLGGLALVVGTALLITAGYWLL